MPESMHTLQSSGDYGERADMHRPADPGVMAAEICRLAANGLKPHDIAGALRVGLGVVYEALRGATP